MKNANISISLTVVLVLSAGSANSSSHKPVRSKHKLVPSSTTRKPSASTEVDTWKPDPKLLNNLTGETQVSSYALRLPEGYSEVPQSPEMAARRQNGFDNHVYGMSRRSDGTAATLGFVIATPPSSMAGTLTLDDALDGTLQQKKHQWQDFTQSPVQDGYINGLAFKRVYFKGMVSGAAGTRMAHGFAYVAINGNSILSFQAEDVEPYNDETIPVAQAAVLTFHKQATR